MRGVVAVLLTLTALTQATAPPGPPYAPFDTLSRFRLDPGFRRLRSRVAGGCRDRLAG